MASDMFFDDKGRRITLGPELGRGGEATVHGVEGQPQLVAKIYHQQPSREKLEKLAEMVRLQNERLLSLAAWPVATLFAAGNKSPAGFLMKNVTGFKDIHLLYNPKSRTREFPAKANWRFLIHAAANTARAFSVIHDHGHVIGDVNQSNIRVSPETAVVNLVDCDSFQISSSGKVYPCEVGVPLFTPPELQEVEFKDVVRTPNHDNFGLAILIFHLLMMGRHPFAGKYLGQGEMPIEKAIAEHRFAFAADTQRTRMLPPPACITLAHLPDQIADLFNASFGAEDGVRPDGRQWSAALESLAGRLMICTNNKAHLFYNGLRSCPWCQIESSGVLLFVDFAIVGATPGFAIEPVWAQILAVQSPGPGDLPAFHKISSTAQPSKRARLAAWKRRGKITAVALVAFVLFVLAVRSDTGFFYFIFLPYLIGALKVLLDRDAPKEFAERARAAEAHFRRLRQVWQREASGDDFKAKLDTLRELTEEYRRLPELRKQKIRQLERALYDMQLRRYLEKFDIASADIPHVKDGRKAMLSAYGITDAADVTRAALEQVPGFGLFLITQMLTWRQSLEATFKFNPGRGIDPSDVQRVDQEVAKRRAELEGLLSKGPGELKVLRQRILASRANLQGQIEQAWNEMAQAQIDESTAA